MVGAQGQISQRQLMEELVVDASTAREHAAQIIERECESPPPEHPCACTPTADFLTEGVLQLARARSCRRSCGWASTATPATTRSCIR
jgi:hypothetical protein